MPVKKTAIAGVELIGAAGLINTKLLATGNAVKISGGRYLSARHVFFGPEIGVNGNYYSVIAGAFVLDPDYVFQMINNGDLEIKIFGTTKIQFIDNISSYVPNVLTGVSRANDIVSFNANGGGEETGVAVFLHPEKI